MTIYNKKNESVIVTALKKTCLIEQFYRLWSGTCEIEANTNTSYKPNINRKGSLISSEI